MHGILCLQFAVGLAGLGWLTRLAGSDWFRGLEPRPEDTTVANGLPRGAWTAPVEAAGAFFASASLPVAAYAAVAIPDGAGPGERIAALGLISALRERSDPQGRRLIVVATVGASGETAFVRQLLDLGAFVVCSAVAGSGEHVHLFPLRMAVSPRAGRLIGVDVADIVQTWQPGRMGTLHSVPLPAPAERALPAARPCRAINIGFQLELDPPGSPLVEMDDFATRCRERYLSKRGTVVFTNTHGIDGRGGSADLLLIADGAGG